MKFQHLSLAMLVLLVSTVSKSWSQSEDFFEQADAFFKEYVIDGSVTYAKLASNPEKLTSLVGTIRDFPIDDLSSAERKAFFINAYNLSVVNQVVINYPLSSVQEVNGFFDQKKFRVANEIMTLNELEKKKLIEVYEDPRLHFVLVCGAVDCPPIIDEAYRATTLDQQMDRQTKLALNDDDFINVDDSKQKANLSEIFKWYASDFGGSRKEVLAFINDYRTNSIPADYGIAYYPYDWSLNGPMSGRAGGNTKESRGSESISNSDKSGNSSARYVVSAAIPKGTFEAKIFNNLYSQRTTSGGDEKTDRASFFTTFVNLLYGVSNRFNAGFELRYRRSRYESLPASPFDVLGGADGENLRSRSGVTTIGPKIRWAPVPKWRNFSVQSTVWFPLRDDWEGTADEPYLDWNKPTWWTQFFNDFTINDKFSLFAEVDFLWEDIGSDDVEDLNRVSTPATLIFSYFPNPKTTLYVLGGYSPYWIEDEDDTQDEYFAQAGLGAKYQFTKDFELELLYNLFTNENLDENDGDAQTINLGIRFNF